MRTKKIDKELVAVLSLFIGIPIIVFFAFVFFPRMQFKYCFKQYIKHYQQETNFKEQNALENCDSWIRKE